MLDKLRTIYDSARIDDCNLPTYHCTAWYGHHEIVWVPIENQHGLGIVLAVQRTPIAQNNTHQIETFPRIGHDLPRHFVEASAQPRPNLDTSRSSTPSRSAAEGLNGQQSPTMSQSRLCLTVTDTEPYHDIDWCQNGFGDQGCMWIADTCPQNKQTKEVEPPSTSIDEEVLDQLRARRNALQDIPPQDPVRALL